MGKLYCIRCGQKVICNECKEIKEYDYKGFKVPIEDVVKKCALCGDELYDEEHEETLFNDIYSQYLKQFNLSFEKFRSIRERFGLSQELFAKLMNWSKKTIIRYENRQSLPQKEYLEKYMELDNNKNKIYELLLFAKNYLNEQDYKKIIKSLEKKEFYPIKQEKLINTILYILDDKELYTTQLMKHLFAADFLYYKNYHKSITGCQYAKLEHGPVLDGYKKILNDFIDSGYIKTKIIDIGKEMESANIKFKASSYFDETIFDTTEIETLRIIKNKFEGKSSGKLSDWSHNFIGWEKTPNSKTISYDYAKYFEI